MNIFYITLLSLKNQHKRALIVFTGSCDMNIPDGSKFNIMMPTNAELSRDIQ